MKVGTDSRDVDASRSTVPYKREIILRMDSIAASQFVRALAAASCVVGSIHERAAGVTRPLDRLTAVIEQALELREHRERDASHHIVSAQELRLPQGGAS